MRLPIIHSRRTDASQAPPKRRRPRWLVVGLPLVGVLGIAAAAWLSTQPTPVRTAMVERGPAIESVYASGVVDFVRQARIAPVTNAPIRVVHVTEGEDVRQGQLLIELAGGPEEATALQMEAQAAQARGAYNRIDLLFRRGFASAAAQEDALRQYQAAEAAARAARERLRDYRITAPFGGRVIRRDAEPGDLAQVGHPLLIIADPQSLRITVDIDERDAGRVAAGLETVVRSDAFPGQQFQARVAEVTPQGDANARVFRARLSLDPSAPLRPGMTVEANIVLGRRDNALLAPASAIRDGAVWTIAEGRALRRTVEIGVQGADQVEILSGVSAGEQVILEPPAQLKDGAPVAAEAATSAAS